jgi:hypothetical protein
MKKSFPCFVAFVILSVVAQSQPYIDVVSVYHQWSPADNSDKSKTPMNVQTTSAFVNMPFKIDSDYVLVNPTYENYTLNLPSEQNSFRLTAAYVPLTWLHQWKNPKWSTAFVAIPRLSGDLSVPVHFNSYQLGAVVLAYYQKKETVKYNFGMYYNSDFFGTFFVPLVGIDWSINKRWNLFGSLPINMNLEYTASKKIHAGFGINFLTNSYRINNSSFLRVDDYNAKFILNYYILKDQVISLETGHSLFRQYRLGTMENNSPNYQYDLNVSGGYLFKVAYVLRIGLDKKN